jgi:hypothetical protein
MEQNSQITINDSSYEILDLKSKNITLNIDKSEELKNEKRKESNNEIGKNIIINIFGKKKSIRNSRNTPIINIYNNINNNIIYLIHNIIKRILSFFFFYFCRNFLFFDYLLYD